MNIRPRGHFSSPAIERLHVPKVVTNPQTYADHEFYSDPSMDGWTPVLLAFNPAYLTTAGRKQILKDLSRLVTRLNYEQHELGTKQDNADAVVRKYWGMKAEGKRPTAELIARSLKLNQSEVRDIVTRIRNRPRAK